MTNCSNKMTVAPPSVALTLPPDPLYLDVTEGGELAVCQSLYDHQWRHQLPLLHVPQNLCNVLLALLARGEERQSLHPQVGVFVTERERGEGRGGGGREIERQRPTYMYIAANTTTLTHVSCMLS